MEKHVIANFALADFADFAGAPEPTPASFSAAPSPVNRFGGAVPTGASAVPWSKWYNVHERHSLGDFMQEGIILGFLVVTVIIHILGTASNRKKAKSWISAHAPLLKNEFALVGFGGPQTPDAQDTLVLPETLMKEKSPQEFATYASGRQNVAFLDVNLTLHKRYSPITMAAETIMGLFFESMPAPTERVMAVLYPFDGREALTVPGQLPGAHELRKDTKSSYDGFVWAIVNKDNMKELRNDRYDVFADQHQG